MPKKKKVAHKKDRSVILHKKQGISFEKTRGSIHISLKHIKLNYQCFSQWNSKDLRRFSALVKKLLNTSWVNIRHNKGLNFKEHKGTPKIEYPKELSNGITFYEMKISEKGRIHGVIEDNYFCIVWLDINHEVFPCKR